MTQFKEKELIDIISSNPKWILIAQENEFFLKAANCDESICFISFPICSTLLKGTFHLFTINKDSKKYENSSYQIIESEVKIIECFEDIKKSSSKKLFKLTREEILTFLK